uniref:Uncharacterized protein n=1 Tax=Tetranychus urticae TaxID=32264 RepID=T1K207_TETUR
MSSDKNKIDKKTIEPLVKLISSLFINEPAHEDLKTTVNTLNPLGVKATNLFQMMRTVVFRQETKKEILVDEFMIPQIKQVIAIIQARQAAVNNRNSTASTNNDTTTNPIVPDHDKSNDVDPDKNKEDDLSSEHDNSITNDGSVVSQSDIHTSTLAAKRKRALEIYDIVKPKNIRLHKPTTPNNVYNWEPIARKFVVYVSGKDYQEGMLFSIVEEAKESFGTIISLEEQKSHAVLILEDEPKRKIAIEVLKSSNLQLEVSEAQYRRPIIKFEINFPITEDEINPLLQEIKNFNLKNFTDLWFKLFKFYKIKGTQYTVICVSVDPKIRDYIADEGKARFWCRKKNLIIADYFDTRKCYVCGQCGHWKCKARQRICLKCSGLHKKASCKSNYTLCPSCRGPHEAFDISCPKFKEEVNRDMNNVDYVYYNIMWTPLF